jgi:hypothetical protein
VNQHKEKVVKLFGSNKEGSSESEPNTREVFACCVHVLKTENSVPPQMCICYAYFAKMCHGV